MQTNPYAVDARQDLSSSVSLRAFDRIRMKAAICAFAIAIAASAITWIASYTPSEIRRPLFTWDFPFATIRGEFAIYVTGLSCWILGMLVAPWRFRLLGLPLVVAFLPHLMLLEEALFSMRDFWMGNAHH